MRYGTALLLAACVNGAFASSCVAGWVQQQSGTANHLYDVTASHGAISRAWACGQDGTILFTSNGGATWTAQESGTTQTLQSIAFIEEVGGVVAAGEGGTILQTSDEGQTWIPRDSGTAATLRDVGDFRWFIAGDGGVILRSTDQGTMWLPSQSGTNVRLNAVAGGFADMAVGEGGTILRSTNQGSSWFPVASGTTLDLHGLPMFANMNLVVGDQGLILRSTNNGVSWFTQNGHTANRLSAAEFSVAGPGRIYCVGDDGTIRKTMDSGQTWFAQASGTSENLNSVFFYLNDNVGYVVGDNGTILKTTDGGGEVTGVPSADEASSKVRFLSIAPNPLRERATVEFLLPAPADVDLRVFDVTGAERASLLRGFLAAGRHELEWDSRDVPSGVYFIRLETDGIPQVTRRLARL